jgi:hypothetical protein
VKFSAIHQSHTTWLPFHKLRKNRLPAVCVQTSLYIYWNLRIYTPLIIFIPTHLYWKNLKLTRFVSYLATVMCCVPAADTKLTYRISRYRSITVQCHKTSGCCKNTGPYNEWVSRGAFGTVYTLVCPFTLLRKFERSFILCTLQKREDDKIEESKVGGTYDADGGDGKYLKIF